MAASPPSGTSYDTAARKQAVAQASERRVNPAVLAHIQVTTEAQAQSLRALAAGTCVVTGQQAGLFGGPLYTLHKAACAIVTARALADETAIPCAPVFWLQNEDHDFEEIRHTTLLGLDDSLQRASVEGLAGQDGRSIWARPLGPSIEGALTTLDEALGELPHARKVSALFHNAYRPERSLSDAFRDVLEHLFAPHGLLLVDPSDPSLVAEAAPVHARAIRDAVPIANALQQQYDALLAAGRPAPVHIRPNAPLSFVHPDGPEGPRFRASPLPDGRYALIGTDSPPLSAEAFQAAHHSTSALLRLALQDTWLPTAAYVGGPGELAYLAQVPPLWRAFELPIPLVLPRSRFVLTDSTTSRLLGQLGLSIDDLQAPRHALLERVATTAPLVDPEALLQTLTAGLNALDPLQSEDDKNLRKLAAKTKGSMQHQAEKLVSGYRRSIAQRDDTQMARLDRIQARLAPDASPQERVHAWPTYGARHGVERLIQSLIDHVVPFDGTLREVAL